jgi:hypothetical protein
MRMKTWRTLIALAVVVIVIARTDAGASNGVQFYADQCDPALPNNGAQDDAAALRSCMAAMPDILAATQSGPGSRARVIYCQARHWNSTARRLRSQQRKHLLAISS